MSSSSPRQRPMRRLRRFSKVSTCRSLIDRPRRLGQMAKKSSIEKNTRRIKLTKRIVGKRTRLKEIAIDRTAPPEERFAAQLKLSELPRNGSATRVRNRCALSGRPRGYYRKFKLSRIALRELASSGQIPGMVKSSW